MGDIEAVADTAHGHDPTQLLDASLERSRLSIGFTRGSDVSPSAEKVAPANVHLHDLRHTGNTLAASPGASLRELMGYTAASEDG